jgi:hypothetical protein
MNRLQEELLKNTDDLPKKFLQELVDFSEFLKQKVRNQAYRNRMEASEKDIAEGRVQAVTPDELFEQIGI